MSEPARRIVEAVRQRPYLTRDELLAATRMNARDLHNVLPLARAYEQGLASVRFGRDGPTYYAILPRDAAGRPWRPTCLF